eukprot:g80288.t1
MIKLFTVLVHYFTILIRAFTKSSQGSFLSEERRGEDEKLFVAESGEDAVSRRVLFNYLQAVWEPRHMFTGCVRFCVVGDCAPAWWRRRRAFKRAGDLLFLV